LDKFYERMTNDGFCKRPALAATGNDGLRAYDWADKNSQKLACLCAESPVCDNRVKNLDGLAGAKIPVLHIVNPADTSVPIEDNTLKLVSRYIKLGGKATVFANSAGQKTEDGYRFPTEEVSDRVDFILANLKKANKSMQQFFTVRDDLKNSQIVFEKEKKGRIVYLGGSITGMQWPSLVSDFIKKRFNDAEIDFVNCGAASMGTTDHVFRLQKDVFSRGKVDLIFVEAAVNDSTNMRTPDEMRRGMEGVIRQLRRVNPQMDIIMLQFADEEKIDSYNNGQVPPVIAEHEAVAEHYKINSLNLALEVTERLNAGEFSWEKDFQGLHPAEFGQKLYADSITEMLGTLWIDKLNSDDKLTTKPMPAMLDEGCYDKCKLISINKARLGSSWRIIDNWMPTKGKAWGPYYANIPMLVCEEAGDAIELDFYGRGIGLAVAAGYDAGIVEFSIDGGPWQKKDLYTQWSVSYHIGWIAMLDATLRDGKHLLKLRMANDKNPNSQGHACRIKAFTVNEGSMTNDYSDGSKPTWQVVSVTSMGAKAEYLIDDKDDTFWDSYAASNSEPPQEIIVDMGKEIHVSGFSCTPRAYSLDGAVKGYEFYLSKDGRDWTKSAEGEFADYRSNPVVQKVKLSRVAMARYFKLVATKTIDGSKYVVISELDIIRN
jgi:sialidase-1